MTSRIAKTALFAALPILGGLPASAHISYGVRDFGSLTGDPISVTVANQAVTSAFGWADGTDADFGDSHRLRAFRVNLATPMTLSITVESIAFGTSIAGLLPGFSIYSGLAHLAPITAAPGSADHDTSAISLAYLASIGGVSKEGVFRSLDTWRVGGDNQTGPVFDFDAIDGLSTFAYQGHAADGTPANFGGEPGIIGDGLADGIVTGTFTLPAGDYSIFVGGADYAATSTASYGIKTTVAVVPEPMSATLLAGGALLLFVRRRRA